MEFFARTLAAVGLVGLIITTLAFFATMIYETFVPPTDAHLPSLLVAAAMIYLLPISLILIVVGSVL